jgi:thiol-disulfide isomerase/thioredoxin
MLSISIGPFAVSVPMAITLIGIILFWGITHWFTRKTPENTRAVDGVFRAVIVGFLIARSAFILTLWSVYKENWWQIFNIRDGGFIPYYGWIAGLLILIISAHSQRKITKAYIKASITTLAVVIPLNFLAMLYSAGLSIPNMTIRDSNDLEVSLLAFEGKPLIVNYWASWCPPCRKEMPVLETAQMQNPAVSFVFVNQGESTATGEAFLNTHGFNLQNVFYDRASQLSNASGAAGLPTTLFFDASGKLVTSHMGELTDASLKYYLQILNDNDMQNKKKS